MYFVIIIYLEFIRIPFSLQMQAMKKNGNKHLIHFSFSSFRYLLSFLSIFQYFNPVNSI